MGDNLICLIIKEDFGEKFADVVNVLLKHGELSLTDLTTESNIPFDEIKHIVIILIKHNIIYFVNKTNPMGIEKNGGITNLSDDFSYKVSVSDVIHRLRFPRMLQHIGKNYGNLAQSIIEDFIENGRFNLSDCIAEMQDHIKAGLVEEYSEREIIEGVATLIKGQYLMQVDISNYSSELYKAANSVADLKPELGVKSSGKRKGTPAKETSKKQKGKKAKVNEDSLNLLADNGLKDNILARLGQLPSKDKITLPKLKDGEITTIKEESKKEEYSKTHSFFYDPSRKEEYMFKLNFRKFIHDFRNQHVVEVVSSKINRQASIIVHVLLAQSQLFSRAQTFTLTEGHTMAEILEKLSHIPVLNESSVEKYLEILEKEKFVKKSGGSKITILPTYSVDLGYLVQKLAIKTLEKIVEEKYGQYHSRIFRVLDNLGYLDEKQISDACMIPLKEARSCIMQLISLRIVDSQDLPGEKGKTNFVYGIRPQTALANLVEDMFKTVFNLKKREIVETEKLNELVETNANEELIDKARLLIRKIESALLELDETVMLFDEY